MNNEDNICPTIAVPVKQLMDYCNPVKNPPWDFSTPITADEIKTAIAKGSLLATPHQEHASWTRKQHIARIAWLVVNGWSNDIEIDVGVPCAGFIPHWPVVDGNHRICAAYFRDDETIAANIGGQIDFAEELFQISWPSDPSPAIGA